MKLAFTKKCDTYSMLYIVSIMWYLLYQSQGCSKSLIDLGFDRVYLKQWADKNCVSSKKKNPKLQNTITAAEMSVYISKFIFFCWFHRSRCNKVQHYHTYSHYPAFFPSLFLTGMLNGARTAAACVN